MTIAQNRQIRKLLRANLEAIGLEVREAASQHHGLFLVGEGTPDLILLDLDLPDDGALKLLRRLQEHCRARRVPIVLLSAEPPGRWLMREAQVAGFLLKPFDVSRLVEQVRDLLGASAPQGSD